MKQITFNMKVAAALITSILLGFVPYNINAQDDINYGRKTSPTVHPSAVPEKTSNDTYQNYGVRSAVTGGNNTQRQTTPQRSDGSFQRRSADGKDIQQVPVRVNNAPSGERPANLNAGTTGEFQRRRAGDPQGQSAQSTNARAADAAYERQGAPASQGYDGGYQIRSAGGKDIQQTPVKSNSSSESIDGYSVKSAGRSSSNATSQSSPSNNIQMPIPVKTVGENYGGYAVRNVGGGQVAPSPSRRSADDETLGGYAVRSAGGNNRQTVRATAEYYDDNRTSRLYRLYEGTKYYDRRGRRTSLSASKSAIVIIMPKEGRAVAGTVIQDRPGSSIAIETPQGTQVAFQYGDIDALVGI